MSIHSRAVDAVHDQLREIADRAGVSYLTLLDGTADRLVDDAQRGW